MTKNLRNRLIIVAIVIIILAILAASSIMSVVTAAIIGSILTGLVLRAALGKLFKSRPKAEPVSALDLTSLKIHQSEDFKKLHTAVMNVKQPLNLVFEGGGARGAVYPGAVQILEQKNLLLGVKNVSGSSAGGITAFLLALGSSASTFKKVSDDFSLATLVDRKPAHPRYEKIANYVVPPFKRMLRFFELDEIFDQLPGLGELRKLFTKEGMFAGNVFMKEAKNQINSLLAEDKQQIFVLCPELRNLEDITFEQFHRLVESDRKKHNGQSKYKDLFLTGTLLGGAGASTEYFSWVHSPSVKLVDALRITMSFPGAFVPHTIVREGIRRTYVDGGVYKNLPAKIFDKDIPLCEFRPKGEQKIKVMTDKQLKRNCNPYTLNFKVDTQPEFDFYTKGRSKRPRRTVLDVGMNLAQKDQISKVQMYYPYNTIVIHDLDVGTLQFELDHFDKLGMFLSGEYATNHYFNLKSKGDLVSAFPNKTAEFQLDDHAPPAARLVLDIKRALKRNDYKNAIELFKQFKDLSTPDKISNLAEIMKAKLDTVKPTSLVGIKTQYLALRKLVDASLKAPNSTVPEVKPSVKPQESFSPKPPVVLSPPVKLRRGK